MSDLQLIQTALQRTAQRRRWKRAWQRFAQGVLVGASVWLLAVVLFKLFPLPSWLSLAGVLTGSVLAVAGLAWGFWAKPTETETARWVDEQQHLKERLSTALEMARPSAVSATTESRWTELVLHDAAEHVRGLDPRQLVRFDFPKRLRWAVLILVAAMGLGLAPEYRTKAYHERQTELGQIRESGRKLVELAKKELLQRPPTLEPTERALESVEQLGERMSKASLTRSDALRDLAKVADKVNQEAAKLDQNPALRRMERAARESNAANAPSPGDLQKQMEALQKSLGTGATADKMEKLQDALQKLQQSAAGLANKDGAENQAAREQLAQQMAELSKQASDMGVSLKDLDEAAAALQANQTDLFVKDLQAALKDLDQLRQMAKALQQMQQQASRLGKDLPEQLENGQARAAQNSLERMREQLKSSGLSDEQMKKLIDEIARASKPGQQYGKAGEHLQRAAERLQKGDREAGSEELAAAAKELKDLLDQLADSEALEAAMDALGRAQLAVSSGQQWGACSACGGQGCGQCRGRGGWKQGGRPGRGVGTWAEEQDGWAYTPENQDGGWDNSNVQRPDMEGHGLTDRPDGLPPNMEPTKVRGQMSPGGPMPSVTLKSVSIKGTSKVKFEEAATAAQQDAQTALNQDQVPRAYRGGVRDYFDDLKK